MMFKKYAAKRLPFFQSSGKHVQARPPREERPPREPESEDLDGALEAALAALETAPPPAESAPAPAASLPGQEEFDAGMEAYEAGEYGGALERLRSAAALGHGEAQFLCGQIFHRGVGREPDLRQALLWYKRAAKQGHIRAQLVCAKLYEEGPSMNLKQSLFWYEQAAKQGSVGAQLKCGCMYLRGRAETRSPKKARGWLETAAENGSAEALQILREHFG